ncbi:hypothetical protein KIN20_033762 [Parelaphostrongylus tenuis]|uniref:Uncharacterized protein n=1 Tax=Parelaphostrongylus tenuis TaxID=148309 RepID=A0AAD5RAZ9_PARTN|nr:hypothetical protein KIN20_033762 [Parelaphostrongylus tenuis]
MDDLKPVHVAVGVAITDSFQMSREIQTLTTAILATYTAHTHKSGLVVTLAEKSVIT